MLLTTVPNALIRLRVAVEMVMMVLAVSGDDVDGGVVMKVLILLPMASIAYRVVNRLIQLTPSGNRATVDHIGRFSDEFGTGRADDQEGEDGIAKTWKTSKPSDFFLFSTILPPIPFLSPSDHHHHDSITIYLPTPYRHQIEQPHDNSE
ncbi:hypothetical protein Tco_0341615 [Tanacetum coccineum]